MELKDLTYWELQKFQNQTFLIQWTPEDGGWLRTKLDSISGWYYTTCSNPFNAEKIGLYIIDRQKRRKQNEKSI